MEKDSSKTPVSLLLKPDVFCQAIAIESALALAVMLSIPGDPKNAWLLGYSSTRLVIMAFLLLMGLVSGIWGWNLRRNTNRARIFRQMARRWFSRPSAVLLVSLGALTAALLLLSGIGLTLNLHDMELRLRLLPLLVWGLVVCVQSLIAALTWHAHLNHQRLASAEVDVQLDLGQVHLTLLFGLTLLVTAGIGAALLSYKISTESLTRFVSQQAVNDFMIKFNLGNENNIPTFFNAVLLLLCAGLLAWLAAGYAQRKVPFAARWGVLSVVFLLLAMDEIADLHRYLIRPIRNALNLTGMWRNAWFLVLLPLLVLLAVWCLPMLKSLPARLRRNIWLAAGLYAGGAMMVNGLRLGLVQAAGDPNLATELLKVLEETLEMGGILLFSHALAQVLTQKAPLTHVSIARRGTALETPNQPTLRMAAWQPAVLLGVITLALLLINLAVELHSLYPPVHELLSKSTWSLLSNLFDLDMETAFPNFFSTFLLITVTVVSAWIAAVDRDNRGGWLGIAVVFFILSLDETASLHNSLVYVYRVESVSGEMQNYFWFVPLIPVLALLGLVYLRFWLRLPVLEKILFIVSGVIYIGGAAGMEVISGWLGVLEGANSRYYNLTMIIEEILEMIGVILFIHSLFHYLAGCKPEFTVKVVQNGWQIVPG